MQYLNNLSNSFIFIKAKWDFHAINIYMNKCIFRLLCLIGVLHLSGCDSSPVVSRYTLKLPELPAAWELIPGQPQWKIEWQNPNGRLQTLEIRSGQSPEISLPSWTSAVLAWPYWPELSIHPGVFKPSGGLFPFDARGTTFSLSWKGGIDAILYRELCVASTGSPAAKTSVPRLPWYFNWPRFRELSADTGVNAEYRADPWLADWPGIAVKIWQSGFDKRRLVPQARQELTVPVAAGPWIGTSPFSAPLFFEGTPVFQVRSEEAQTGCFPVETWVCARGILRCTAETFIFLEWEEANGIAAGFMQ